MANHKYRGKVDAVAAGSIVLPGKIKCRICKKIQRQERYSNTQLTEIRHKVYTGAIKKDAILLSSIAKCRTCAGSPAEELFCTACKRYKVLEEYSKSQRGQREVARCLDCVELDERTEPGKAVPTLEDIATENIKVQPSNSVAESGDFNSQYNLSTEFCETLSFREEGSIRSGANGHAQQLINLDNDSYQDGGSQYQGSEASSSGKLKYYGVAGKKARSPTGALIEDLASETSKSLYGRPQAPGAYSGFYQNEQLLRFGSEAGSSHQGDPEWESVDQGGSASGHVEGAPFTGYDNQGNMYQQVRVPSTGPSTTRQGTFSTTNTNRGTQSSRFGSTTQNGDDDDEYKPINTFHDHKSGFKKIKGGKGLKASAPKVVPRAWNATEVKAQAKQKWEQDDSDSDDMSNL